MEEIVYEVNDDKTYCDDLFFIFKKSLSNIQIKKVKFNDIPPEEFNIIYKNVETDTKIIIKDEIKLYDKVYAIQDSNQPNRYFVGLTYYCSCTILGFIVYFDDLGNSKGNKILNKILCGFDIRNGIIKTFLFNQTLLFTQIQRDTGSLIVFINILSHEDSIVSKNVKYTNIIANKHVDNVIDYKRFILVVSNENNILIDLGSVKYSKEYKYCSILKKILDCFVINIYKVNIEEIDSFIKDFNDEPEYFGNGYPDNCIRCKKLTSIGKFGYKYLYMELGESYCKDCNIRFSKLENRWICCKLNIDNNFCLSTVTTGKLCNFNHSTTMKIIITNEKETFISPFKRILYISKTDL